MRGPFTTGPIQSIFGYFIRYFSHLLRCACRKKHHLFCWLRGEKYAMISFVTGCAFLVVAFISPLLSGPDLGTTKPSRNLCHRR